MPANFEQGFNQTAYGKFAMTETFAGLRRKMGSASDLQSVVRAMKALAASNVSQYEKSALALADYFECVEQGLGVCFRRKNLLSKAFTPNPKNNSSIKSKSPFKSHLNLKCAVVFGSDQGLVGQFNTLIAQYSKNALENSETKVWAVGERVAENLLQAGFKLEQVFDVPQSVKSVTPLVTDILVECHSELEKHVGAEFHLFYNHHKKGASYEPAQQQLLPLDIAWQVKMANKPWPAKNLPEAIGGEKTLHAMIREFLFVSLFRACSESLASENASRLAAMQRAEKNIRELLENLGGVFHRLRQEQIDEELFDVVSGFEALGKSK